MTLQKINFDINDFKSFLPIPKTDTNKYSRGQCIVVAGSKSYPGAAVLCSLSACRSGTGYVSLYTDKSYKRDISIKYPNLVCKSFNDLNSLNFKKIHEPFSLVVGPGFLPGDTANDNILINIINNCNAPVVIDGGALGNFKNHTLISCLIKRSQKQLQTVITPHLGEADRIMKWIPNSVYKKYKSVPTHDFEVTDSFSLCRVLSGILGCVCVLKGPNTFIFEDNNFTKYTSAGPELSCAGSGDVLAGIIGSILSTGTLGAFLAAVLGVHIHSISGCICKQQLGPISTTAIDVCNNIPASIKEIYL